MLVLGRHVTSPHVDIVIRLTTETPLCVSQPTSDAARLVLGDTVGAEITLKMKNAKDVVSIREAAGRRRRG